MTMIEIPVDETLQADAQQVLAAEGITISEAVEKFLRTVVDDHNSSAVYRVPNEKTLAAIREADEGKLQEASTVEEFLRRLNEED